MFRGPNPPQMGQTWYHSTPLYLYIHNIKLVFPSSQVCVGLEWENIVLHQAECSIALAFPNPSGPNPPQMGQTWYQCTSPLPLHS